MTKSVLSLLIGCAMEDGLMGSVDEPIARYLPELRGHRPEKVTLRHLLLSTSGLDYAENDNPFGIHAYMYYCERCIERQALAFRLAEEPGTRFVYKSGDNILLATALHRALRGETITAYLQRRVWNPLGMESGLSSEQWRDLFAVLSDAVRPQPNQQGGVRPGSVLMSREEEAAQLPVEADGSPADKA